MTVDVSREIAALKTPQDFNAYLSSWSEMPSQQVARRAVRFFAALSTKVDRSDPAWDAVWRRMCTEVYGIDPAVFDVPETEGNAGG